MIGWVDHVLWHALSTRLARVRRWIVERDDGGTHELAKELPGLTFMLLTLSALGARPSWADEKFKIQMLTLPGCVYSNILAAILVWS